MVPGASTRAGGVVFGILFGMNRAVAIVLGVTLTIGASVAGTVLWRTDEGRSTVGVARRTDGSVTVVTAWCAGPRVDEPRIDTWVESGTGPNLMTASGSTTDSITMHIVGRPESGMAESVNKPLPEDRLLVAYNAGRPDTWWPRDGYPSSATVFRVNELPVSDTPMPRDLVVGDGETVSATEFVENRCSSPSAQSTDR